MSNEETALAPIENTALLSPSPVFRGAHMVQALTDYRDLQKALDESMPEQVMTLDGRPFRKKGYWRAIAVAFNLTVEPITNPKDERSVVGILEDGTENYVYSVAYRATTATGRSAIGDGTCAAAEKQKGRMKATEHNVRSHAHTRAFNRSVSNLVGFGEVSAEEVDRDEHEPAAPTVDRRADGSALVSAVTEKKGTGKTGKPWTNFTVALDDGRAGTTFDAKLAELARGWQVSGTRVIPTLEQSGQYTNLTGLKPYVVEAEAESGEPDTVVSDMKISDAMRKKFWAIAHEHKWNEDQVKALLEKHGLTSTGAITRPQYDPICNDLKNGPPKEGTT